MFICLYVDTVGMALAKNVSLTYLKLGFVTYWDYRLKANYGEVKTKQIKYIKYCVPLLDMLDAGYVLLQTVFFKCSLRKDYVIA